MKQNISLFSRMLLWQKFVILGTIALVLVILPFSFYIIETEKSINTAVLETQGIPPTQNLLELVRLLQKHRGLSARLLSGDTQAATQREETKVAANQLIDTMNPMMAAIPNTKINEDWKTITEYWHKLQTQVDKKDISVADSFQEHINVIEDYLSLSDKVADQFNLTLESEAKNYFMIQSFIYANPALTETLGKLRALGSGLLVAKQATPAELQRLSGLVDLAASQRKIALSSLEKAFALDPMIKTELESLTKDASENYKNAIELVQKEILNTPQLTYAPKDYFDTYTKTIDSYSKRNEKGMQLLATLLNNKAKELRQREINISSGLLILLLIGSLFTFYIIRSITKPVTQLVDVMQKLSAGDNTIRVNPQTFDELGLMGRQFDMMVDQRELVNATIQKENETL
ncbi:MAG: nitrate- and nitrite sensing domain-containing protein, partial [Methylococcaceae bacterium]|nr:nitrate- and nitrite sensing domain-containing protein [Methylococcaceae bacterium]